MTDLPMIFVTTTGVIALVAVGFLLAALHNWWLLGLASPEKYTGNGAAYILHLGQDDELMVFTNYVTWGIRLKRNGVVIGVSNLFYYQGRSLRLAIVRKWPTTLTGMGLDGEAEEVYLGYDPNHRNYILVAKRGKRLDQAIQFRLSRSQARWLKSAVMQVERHLQPIKVKTS